MSKKSSRTEADWGSDDWDEEEGPDGDDDFDYEEFVENEFGGGKQRKQHLPWVRIVAFTLIVIFVLLTFLRLGL